jgi:hypothetical protein
MNDCETVDVSFSNEQENHNKIWFEFLKSSIAACIDKTRDYSF